MCRYLILLFYCCCHAPRLLLPSAILLIGIFKCYKSGRDVFPLNLKMNCYLILLFYCCCHAPHLLLPSSVLLIGTQSHPTMPKELPLSGSSVVTFVVSATPSVEVDRDGLAKDHTALSERDTDNGRRWRHRRSCHRIRPHPRRRRGGAFV